MLIKKLIIILCLSFLCACAKTPSHDVFSSSFEMLTYPDSVNNYQQLADLTEDEVQKKALLLKVTGRLIYEGRLISAEQQLSVLSNLPLALQNEKNLLQAKLALLKKHPVMASRLASRVINVDRLSSPLQKFYHQLLADIYHARHQALNEARQLIALDSMQRAPLAHLATRRAIWRVLSAIPLKKEKAIQLEASGSLEGWLSLNVLYKELEAQSLIQAVFDWKQAHPTHAANDIIKTSSKIRMPSPNKIALLLPLSGSLKGPGQAIREGFMSSYFKSKQKGAMVRFYDTNDQSAAELYDRAIKEGADFVIGPLVKSDVEKISNHFLPVPTIALNDAEGAGANNFYSFSIDPQNEARQLAYKVHQDGFRRALVIAPKGDWGGSVASAFEKQWQAQGSEVVDHFYFDHKTNVNASIRDFLAVSLSHDRYNDLVQTIWKRPKFYARRRQDFDVIILLSYASMARQIRPMLKYYYAGDMPVYGTSLLYSGSKKQRQDMDLNGIIFGEMPYLLSQNRPSVSKSWPEQFNSYNRLYAMGQDAYLLTHQLTQLMVFPLMGVRNNTGTLFIDENRQVVRQLEWAHFKNGVVKPL